MKEYRVQAILIDGIRETVIDSFKTTDYMQTLDFVMQRHKFSNSYLYIVMDIETHEIVYKSKENKYFFQTLSNLGSGRSNFRKETT